MEPERAGRSANAFGPISMIMVTNSIDILPWGDDFETGLPEVDEARRGLLQTLNRLAGQLACCAQAELADLVIEELVGHLANHFMIEDAIWHEYFAGDPVEFEHRAVHRAFLLDLSRLASSGRSRPRRDLAEETIGLLARWLASHMLGCDRRLANSALARRKGVESHAARLPGHEHEHSPAAPRTSDDLVLGLYTRLCAGALQRMRELNERQLDTVELLRARQELRDSEINFRFFFDTIDDFLFVLDGEGLIQCVNRSVVARLGYPETGLVGHSVLEVHPEDTHDEAKRIIGEMLGGTRDICLIPLLTVDGHLIPVETRVVAGRWNGRPALFAVSRDVSDRRRKEAERDDALALLDAAIEQSPSGILIADAPDAHIRFANAVALGMCSTERGLPSHAEVAQHTTRWRTFHVDGTVYPADELPLLRAIRSGQVTENEEAIIRDGNDHDHRVLVNAAPIRRAGQIVAGIVIFQEISAHRQLERELSESKRVLQAVLDAVPVRIFWKDTESRYLGCNPLFARDAGMADPGELLGKDDYQMAWADQADLYRADDRRVMASGAAKLNFDEPQTTPDGRTIYLRTSKVPLRDDQGETFGMVGMYDDITEQKQAEEQRRDQLHELRRWQAVMLDREDRILDLKREVNELLARLDEPPRYGSAAATEIE